MHELPLQQAHACQERSFQKLFARCGSSTIGIAAIRAATAAAACECDFSTAAAIAAQDCVHHVRHKRKASVRYKVLHADAVLDPVCSVLVFAALDVPWHQWRMRLSHGHMALSAATVVFCIIRSSRSDIGTARNA